MDSLTDVMEPLLMRAKTRVGTVLREKWTLDVLLGVGGMASVYAATHRNGSRVAVKILHAELSINEEIRKRFLREGYVANAVGHDGAVRVIDDDTAEDGSLFLVTELLDGETLEDRRERAGGRLGEDDVLAAMDQVLEVLVAAHAKGIVHRDLKPENVFVTRAGQIKLLDFGIARLVEMSGGTKMTKTGTTLGTPAFMPPEQARGLWDEVDARTDLWAVGAIMFNLLTGRLVHEGRTANEQLLFAMTKPAPRIESLLPGVPPAVARVVDRALAFERDERWADASKMQQAVRHAYHDRHGAPLSTGPKLDVPASVPNRTLPSTDVAVGTAKLPTTGQPVANGATGPGTPTRWSVRRKTTAAVLAAACAVSAIAIGFVHFQANERAPGTAASISIPTPIATPTPTPTQTSTPTSIPTPTATAASTSRPTPRPPSSCDPPFRIDPVTHKKTFKLECL